MRSGEGCGDLPGWVDGHRSRIHPGDECFHAALRIPAETDPERDAGGCTGCG